MTEREALLAAVCENPDEDTPRLVFADWLDEHGEPERAEFIRVQIALAGGSNDEQLKQREKALLTAHREAWLEPFRQFEVAGSSRRFMFGVHYRRGFVWALSLNDEDLRFVASSAELLRLAPIERVNLFHKAQHEDLSECPALLRVRELLVARGEGFDAAEIALLLRSKYLTNIVHLDLIADDDNGHLDIEGVQLLSRTKALSALRYLDLSYNWCNWDNDNSWVATLAKGKLVEQLETLRLAGTFMTEAGAVTLARCKRVGSLRHLDLSGNSIGEVGLRAIANSRTLSALTTLDLRGNRYETDDGVDMNGCPPELRQLLEVRFGAGLLLDGKPDPHPIDEWFKQFK